MGRKKFAFRPENRGQICGGMVNCQGRIEWVQSGGLLPTTRARLYREAGATSLKHAIIVTGGKQYRVAEGDVIFVEKLDVEAGETVKFDRVLAVIDEDKAVFGTPVVENAVVSGNVVKNGKSKKIRVYKMKPKKGYRRTQGHRQPYTKVEITKIEA